MRKLCKHAHHCIGFHKCRLSIAALQRAFPLTYFWNLTQSRSIRMECIGALDQGTTSTRFFLYDKDAKPLASHQVEFPQYQPKAGWFEHDPLEIWESVEDCVHKCLQEARSKFGKEPLVKAIGITNQRETTVAWDTLTGQPLHNAIVWLDNRTAPLCHKLIKELGSSDYFRPITGLPISTYFSAYKMKWLLDNVPSVAEAAQQGRCMFGTVDSWLIYRFTGAEEGGLCVTDVTNASRTNLMEVNQLMWHQETCQRFGVQTCMLPKIVSNSEVYGYIKSGPLQGVPIAGCLGDQQAALLGQRCREGEAKNTYGTGCFLLLNTGQQPVSSSHGLLTTLGFQLGPSEKPYYALEGSIAFAGGGISWLADKLQIISDPAESEVLAGSVCDTAGVYFVPAFGGLLAPHWRDDARGVILGLTAYTTRAHIVRALLEAICFQTREVLEAMRKDADMSHAGILRVDGGASRNNLLLQLQADILQNSVERPQHMETTSLGAAFAAGLAVGVFSEQDIFGCGIEQQYRVFEPSVPAVQADRRFKCWKKAVERSLNLDDLNGLNGNLVNGLNGNNL